MFSLVNKSKLLINGNGPIKIYQIIVRKWCKGVSLYGVFSITSVNYVISNKPYSMQLKEISMYIHGRNSSFN